MIVGSSALRNGGPDVLFGDARTRSNRNFSGQGSSSCSATSAKSAPIEARTRSHWPPRWGQK